MLFSDVDHHSQLEVFWEVKFIFRNWSSSKVAANYFGTSVVLHEQQTKTNLNYYRVIQY